MNRQKPLRIFYLLWDDLFDNSPQNVLPPCRSEGSIHPRLAELFDVKDAYDAPRPDTRRLHVFDYALFLVLIAALPAPAGICAAPRR